MKHLIPQHLFEMSKISDNLYIDKNLEFYEYCLDNYKNDIIKLCNKLGLETYENSICCRYNISNNDDDEILEGDTLEEFEKSIRLININNLNFIEYDFHGFKKDSDFEERDAIKTVTFVNHIEFRIKGEYHKYSLNSNVKYLYDKIISDIEFLINNIFKEKQK
jgi:hypothetical protein